MPGLAEVLNDPNYVNANAETKAAIFDKFSASDTNFTGANPETQQAIRVKFGLTAPSQPRTLLSQIPGAENAPAPKVEAKPSLYQRVLGAAEVPLRVGLGAITEPIAGAAGVLGTLTSGAFGTQEGIRRGQDIQQRVRQLNQPTTETGAQNLQAVGQVLEPLMGVPIPTMNALAQGVAAPLRMGTNALRGEAQLVGGAIADKVKARAAATQAINEAASYANAPQIEAAQIGTRLKLAADPSVSNPTAATRAFTALAGPKLSADLSTRNIARVKQLVREDLAAPEGRITPATINTALANASKESYDVVRKLPTLAIPPKADQALRGIPTPALIGGDAAAAEVSALVDNTLTKLGAGRNGSLVLDDIRELRTEANATLKAADIGSSPPKPSEMARAKAQMQIADILESVIDANAPKEVLPALLAGRKRMAQIYEHQRAFDFAGQTFDPRAYVKMYNERQGNMTGLGADIAQFAAANPAVMTNLAAKGYLIPRIVRGSLGATAGGALGAITGNPVGIGAGMAAGIAAERGLGNLVTRKMATPAFQAKYAVPQDFRRPAPDTGLSLAPGYEPSPFRPREAPPTQAGNQFTLGEYQPPQAPAQLQMPSIDYPPGGLNSRPYTVDQLIRRQQEAAEAAQRATETATRLPTGRGMALEMGPEGKLRPASQGMVGATPDTIESAGATLQSAIAKLTGTPTRDIPTQFSRVRTGRVDEQGAPTFTVRGKETTTYDTGRVYPEGTPKAGQPVYETIERTGPNTSRGFALTAEEKIAWDKTRVDLADAVPGFNKLSDKAILGKMQDRAWVADAIQKARDQAKGFEAIARRSNDQIVSARADAQRARMMDLAESLEESLRARPVEIKNRSQGPKTRAARRNELAPEDAVIVTPSNALRP